MHLSAPLVVVLVALVLLTRFWRTLDARLAASAAGLDDALAELRDFPAAIDRRLQARRPVDLRRLLDEMPRDCASLLRGSRIALVCESSAAAPTVLARGDELRQLLAHVAAIAVHAMPRGGVLNARLATEERHARLEFTDVGDTSPEPLLAALYLHGAQGGPASGALARGELAASVASCRRIVAAHEGRIEVLPTASGAPGLAVRLPLHAARA